MTLYEKNKFNDAQAFLELAILEDSDNVVIQEYLGDIAGYQKNGMLPFRILNHW